MKRVLIVLVVLAFLGLAAVTAILSFFLLSARTALDQPNPLAITIAETGKLFLVPPAAQSASNPVTSSPEVLTAAHTIYQARCVVCHGGDGKAQTPIGSHIYPRAADLTAARTQSKSDGTLHWIIQNGLPHTGMPGWQPTLSDEQIWQLVTFVRALPNGVPADVKPTPQATSPTVEASSTYTITVNNFTFPPQVTVAPGTKVVWVNTDDENHTVTSVGEPKVLDSPEFAPNQSFDFVFDKAGTYQYTCKIHTYMSGEIIVK